MLIYPFKDYKKYFGGNIEDYKDYLVNRHFHREHFEEEPVRIIDVPFVFEEYRKWNKGIDTVDAHRRWALKMAEDTDSMEKLNKLVPILPLPPLQECSTVQIIFAFIPLIFQDKQDIKTIGARLPEKTLYRIIDVLKNKFSDLPNYETISKLRCRGVKYSVADRLIPPDSLQQIEENIEDLFQNDRLKDIYQVPKNLRATAKNLETKTREDMIIGFAFLPIVVVGADAEIEYIETMLEYYEHELNTLSPVICDLVNSVLGNTFLDGSVLLFSNADKINAFLKEIFKNLDKFNFTDVVPFNQRKARNRLTLVK
ncbi:hypothetical protein SAMN02745133_01939 [Desulforamulus putei DSM 12395]|uniref:Uncharacterized protein n=2 Tax=Desulforamulus putei TaxID=74701 RepID=A0A1M4ZCD6_9FIRM|nr:hypothetical protein SAMN02745133_01939 [Desulforamulus putei DSM 12395]